MNENTSPPYSSTSVSSASHAGDHSMPMIMHGMWNSLWRILIVAVGYTLASTNAGRLLGKNLELGAAGISLLSGILIGATLARIAAQMAASPFRHWIVWASVLFLNALSVGIEGAFFAPTLSPLATMPIAWSADLPFQSLVTAGLIAWLCQPPKRC